MWGWVAGSLGCSLVRLGASVEARWPEALQLEKTGPDRGWPVRAGLQRAPKKALSWGAVTWMDPQSEES